MIQPRETSPLCSHVYTNRSRDAYSKTVIFITFVTFCFVVPMLTFLCGVYLSDNAPEPHPYWDPPTSEEHCHSYGTREYTARLINISWKYDKMLWCERTPIVIHNVTFERPDFCEVGTTTDLFVDVTELTICPHQDSLGQCVWPLVGERPGV